ncbi:NACHT, LRR and PYD domains-containing protein 3-like [Strongylocentrotus purpuratus]|uniref:NACHT domain-containing protein n=1 Tax=Strongylocentrotus purpuratus TaxID=7668 RepID=A0A7M7NAD9_STRPU|nr:NACHT, LRR and PYD domains-containing protein 3-like [Strongylocentrotus purpuratus]
MEFLKLAQDIDPSYYYNVGISLGFSHAQLKVILIENLKNFKDALMDVFMNWNVKQQPPHSNKRQLLADKLREVDLGGLSDGLLNEPLIPNSTGGPSRLLESHTNHPSAGFQTKPLSPELVERCANDFKFKYRSTVCKIRADPLNPASTVQFQDMYTNLVLLEEHGTEKQMLDYNDILDLKVNGEFPKRIMVQGEAGAGKSTFCAKIAWDWIEGMYFSHFVWVLIVPLREFKQHNIGKIAKSYLAKNNPTTASQITEYIQSNPDKVFIALDGLDEVSGKIMKSKSRSRSTDQMQLQPSQPSVNSSEACGSSSETGDIGLVDILCSDQLASCPVLVTTRPWRAVEIRSDGDLMKLYTFIRVQGFNRENLSVYIHKYFPKNEDKANQLIQFTHENDVISENMAHYPIYVAMLCLMWKELDRNEFNRLIEQVVLPRKGEFRYLLYFTVSQNKSIATHVMKSMLQGLNRDSFGKELPFIVDVAFESQDPDVAALVRDSVSSEEIKLVISRDMTAHAVAGYAFIGPHVF